MSRKRARDPHTPSSEGNVESTDNFHEDPLIRLTTVMKDILASTVRKPDASMVRGDVVPIFNPEDSNQDIDTWCLKVDELRDVFSWSEEATIYFALARLRGLAEIWYKGLSSIKLNWVEWKEKLKRAFPYRKDYCDMLTEMLRRRKRFDETYTKYFYEKCALLNSCKIEGPEAVSCILGGIDDNVVKTGAKAGKYQTPESLHEFLNTIGSTSAASGINKSGFGKFKKQPRFSDRSRGNMEISTKGKETYENKGCYKCGKSGHIAKTCTAPNNIIKCSYCRRPGHVENNCFQKKREHPKPVA